MRARGQLIFMAAIIPMAVSIVLAPVAVIGETAGRAGQVDRLGFSTAVPSQLNYQGFLVNADDSLAINATLEMTFRLFDSATDGTELWSEIHSSVQVNNGLFQVLLGDITPFPGDLFDGPALWLQTEVGAEALSPRKSLVSIAYSFRAQTAEEAAMADWATGAQHAVYADTADYSQTSAAAVAESALVADDAHHLEGYTCGDLDDRWVDEDQADAITSEMITDGEIVDADICPTAAIDPTKVSGTAWTGDNDGPGSGLDADLLDGQQAADFLSSANDWGRPMVTTELYEGDATLSDRYVEESDLDHLDAADGTPNSAVYVDNAGQVGIGTTTPNHTLDVSGDVSATTYYGDGSHLTGVSSTPDNDWTISGTDMYSAVPGNVGIGTAGPAKKLHVAGDIQLDDGSSETEIVFVNSNHRVYKYGDDLFMTTDDDLYLIPDDNIYIAPDGGANWIVFDTGQKRVGIGTTAPSANLDVRPSGGSYTMRSEWDGSSAGAALLAKNTGTDGDAIQANADGTGRSAIYARGSSGVDYAIYSSANGATWSGYFSGKAYVSDQLGLGTTSPQNKLDVEGAMVIGSSYSGSSTAPSNGMLVQGNVGLGTISPGSHRLHATSSASGVNGSTLYAENTSSTGITGILDGTSSDLVVLISQHGSGDILRCDSWTGGWHPVFKVENDGRVVCSELELTGGSDLSEPFEVRSGREDVGPGMLVSIDPHHPGELMLSTQAYDRRVAGIISGAGQVGPGILMSQRGSSADGRWPVALTGRVYCWADAAYGSIEPGNLLTSSNTPGHTMRVDDYGRAQGAIVGKAMSCLAEGRGLVLVLVTLQ